MQKKSLEGMATHILKYGIKKKKHKKHKKQRRAKRERRANRLVAEALSKELTIGFQRCIEKD